MNQLTLVLPFPATRRRDPATSHAAAAKAAAVAPSHRNIIADCLREHGPLTVKQIAERTGLTQYAASKRLPELERLGLAEPTGEVIDGCRVWRKKA